MAEAFVPWNFLASASDNHVVHAAKHHPKPTFADTLKKKSDNVCSFAMNQLPAPCLKGDAVSVSITEEEYLVGLEDCKTCLHGRLLLPKGSQPPRYTELKDNVSPFLSHLKNFRLIPLGKGYFELAFETVENMRQVLSMGSWNLNPGVMRLFSWTKDFNPYLVKHTNAHCWVRMYGIPREYL